MLHLVINSENSILPYQSQIVDILNNSSIEDFWLTISGLLNISTIPKKLLKFIEFLIL